MNYGREAARDVATLPPQKSALAAIGAVQKSSSTQQRCAGSEGLYLLGVSPRSVFHALADRKIHKRLAARILSAVIAISGLETEPICKT